MSTPKVIVGFLTYGQATLKYLPDFIDSLKNQTYGQFEVLVLDNSPASDRENEFWLKANYPEATIFLADRNLGFARGANYLLDQAQARGTDYFWLLNPDTLLSTDALAVLLNTSLTNPDLAAASPKVLRWDFEHKTKTKIIDTCGLVLRPGFKFIDLGQGAFDKGQFDKAKILGPSGCSAWFNLSALGAIRFDEKFFMYKEDCDLAYQLFLADLKTFFVPQAVIYHDRTITRGPRSAKGLQGRQWSFYGQHLLLLKYWRRQNLWSKLTIIVREILMLGYVIIFEPYLLRELKKAIKNYR